MQAGFIVISGLSKGRNKILFFDIFSNLLAILYFSLMSRYIPVVNCIFFLLLNWLSFRRDKGSRLASKAILPLVLVTLSTTAFAYKDVLDILVIAATFSDLIARYFKGEVKLRVYIIISKIMWFFYLLLLGRPFEASLNIVFLLAFSWTFLKPYISFLNKNRDKNLYDKTGV